MSFNYSVKAIRIPSKWFDVPDRNKNTFSKMGGYKGFYLYLQLYKFRIHDQENDHTFLTSISMLRKETKCTTEEIFDLLKKLKSAKIINPIPGVSKWSYLVNEDGTIKEDKILHITVNPKESFSIHTDFDIQEGDYYIWISFSLLRKYEEEKLDEKHFALHCLIQRMQHNKKKVCYMAIETMGKVLSLDKDTINRMIINLNRHYLLSSWRTDNSSKRGYGSTKYNHIVFLDNNQFENKEQGRTHWEGWLYNYKEKMDIIVNRADKKAERKRKTSKKSKKVYQVKKTKIIEFPTVSVEEEIWGEPIKQDFHEEIDYLFDDEIDDLL